MSDAGALRQPSERHLRAEERPRPSVGQGWSADLGPCSVRLAVARCEGPACGYGNAAHQEAEAQHDAQWQPAQPFKGCPARACGRHGLFVSEITVYPKNGVFRLADTLGRVYGTRSEIYYRERATCPVLAHPARPNRVRGKPGGDAVADGLIPVRLYEIHEGP